MDRRSFIRLGGLATIATVFGLSLGACTSDEIPSQLKGPLSTLYDKRFGDYASLQGRQALYGSLLQKGVISESGELLVEKVATLAQDDPVVEYNGSFYTETELELYALAFLVNAGPQEEITPTIATLPAVDLMGGDLRSLKTPNGADDCAAACESDPACNAFTYAKQSHPNKGKRNHCWLKSVGFRYGQSPHYISGIKP